MYFGPAMLLIDPYSNGKSITGQTEVHVINFIDIGVRIQPLSWSEKLTTTAGGCSCCLTAVVTGFRRLRVATVRGWTFTGVLPAPTISRQGDPPFQKRVTRAKTANSQGNRLISIPSHVPVMRSNWVATQPKLLTTIEVR